MLAIALWKCAESSVELHLGSDFDHVRKQKKPSAIADGFYANYSRTFSKIELSCQLGKAREVQLTSWELTKCGAVDIRVWAAALGVIEQVERFAAQHHSVALTDADRFLQRRVYKRADGWVPY